MPGNEGLSELDVVILRKLPKVDRIEDLAKEAGQSPATVGEEIAKLQLEGYIADDGSLTAKGEDAARET
jgi:Mn-dependent DtxR family transcriptional regulator